MNKQGLVIEGEKNQPYLNRAMKLSMGREQQADSFHGIRQWLTPVACMIPASSW